MKFVQNVHSLHRGIGLVSQIAKARIAQPHPGPPPEVGRMVTYSGFGDNPGRLKMLTHLPPDVAGQPLVVLLHGCGQDATSFAVDSGWTDLADRLRFPLILPEQTEARNAGRCFQWYQTSDTARNAGEAASIAGMTQAAIERFDSDPARVFIVGLSAGGAMAAAMLAAYPEMFAAGASIAGLAVGSAQGSMQAILRMAAAEPDLDPAASAARVLAAAPAGFSGPWPRLSIWQGLADNAVAPDNAAILAMQWRALHGLGDRTMVRQAWPGVERQAWWAEDPPQQDEPQANGPQVELWSFPQMAHGYPVGNRPVQPGHFMLQAPIDATAAIAAFFGLA